MKKFNLGQSITILANVGVIAGIVFLGIELRQNNDQLAVQIILSRNDNRANDIVRFATEGELAEMQVKLKRNQELSEVEYERAFWAYGVRFHNWQTSYEIDGDSFSTVSIAAHLRRDPYLIQFWNEFRDFLDADFVELIETEVINR